MSILSSYQHRSRRRGAARPRQARCAVAGCNGEIVRHSLGCGMAIGRCVRCFTRYDIAEPAEEEAPARRGFLHEILTWREDD